MGCALKKTLLVGVSMCFGILSNLSLFLLLVSQRRTLKGLVLLIKLSRLSKFLRSLVGEPSCKLEDIPTSPLHYIRIGKGVQCTSAKPTCSLPKQKGLSTGSKKRCSL